jgi:hypothetical protein
LGDAQDRNAAQILMDPKSELAGLCLGLTPPDCGKRVYHLDLARPWFGITPLRLRDHSASSGEFAIEVTAIAEGIVAALSDLNPEQIFQSSKRFLYHAIIAECATARAQERRPQFEGVYRLLLPTSETERNRAADACARVPDLAATAAFFMAELPAELRVNGANTAQRLDAPRNKVAALTANPAIRRFLNHGHNLPISEIVTNRDILIVDANMAGIGQENAQTLMALIFRQLHQHMQWQVQQPEAERPRVAVILDEAHYLVSENVVDQIATHRAAGMDVALGLQYFGQLGAGAPSLTATEKIRDGVLNLAQSRCLFRMGKPEDAEVATRIAMAVYESMIRADSRDYHRITPEQVLNLPNHHFLGSWIAGGARAASFIGRTYPFPASRSLAWQEHHLRWLAERGYGYQEELGDTHGGFRRVEATTTRRSRGGRAQTAAGAEPATDEAPGGSPASETGAGEAPSLTPGPAEDRQATPAGEVGETGGEEAQPEVWQRLPAAPLDQSDVLRVVARPAAKPEPPRERGDAPWLLRELVRVDTIEAVQTTMASTNPGKPGAVKLLDGDYAILKVLDRVGYVARDTLGYAALGPKAPTRTVQHRLQKLHEAGLVSRADPVAHRPRQRLPNVYAITRLGLAEAQRREPPAIHPERRFREIEGRCTTLRHDHHVLHWLLQLQELLGHEVLTDHWRTPRYATGRLAVPQAGAGHKRHRLELADLRFPEGTSACGEGSRRPFRDVEPDLCVELRLQNARRGPDAKLRGLTLDLLVELDRTGSRTYQIEKYERYDALLLGWWQTIDRYRRLGTRPAVIFLASSREKAREYAATADAILTAAIGRLGSPPQDWYYPGREHVLFACEEDLYHGSLRALVVAKLPPQLRRELTGSAAPAPRVVDLVPPTMIAAAR